MTKSTISPFLETGPTDAGRNGCPDSVRAYSSQSFQSHSAPAVRTSVLASVVPKLRLCDDMLTHPKSPLLTLKLSSPSFLDSVVNDDFTAEPLYIIKTVGPSTTIERADPRGEENATTMTADIKWPKTAPAKGVSDGILIQLRGARWKGGETLLRRGTLPGSPRRFNIPNYSQTLKWRRVGVSYWCITTAVKGPIAIFEPSVTSSPARLVIFETLHDRYDARPMLVHHGVSLLLLDYLLVTSLLLVTDAQEWMSVHKHQGKDVIIPSVDVNNGAIAIPASAPSHISTSASQWRKVMFGEPIYRKRSSSPSSISSLSTETEGDAVPSTPSSTNEIAALVYDQVRNSSSSDISSTSEGDHAFFSTAWTRPPSPSSESIFYPLTPSSAPSHTYLDPSFYGESSIPPVPSIPAWCIPSEASSTLSPTSRPSSEHSSSSSKQLRVLPMPPASPITLRPRSTPPKAITSPRADKGLSVTSATPIRRLPEHPEPNNALPRGSLRQLPRPPSTDRFIAQSRVLSQRSRSHSRSTKLTEKWHPQYKQRTLPLPPSSSSLGSIGFEQGFRHHTHKEDEGELAEWVHTLTSSAPHDHPPVPLPRTSFDLPPPAYDSIEFHGKMLSNSSPPPSSGVDS